MRSCLALRRAVRPGPRAPRAEDRITSAGNCFHFDLVGEGEERCSEFRVYAGPTVRPLDSRVTGKEPATPEDFQTRLKAELRTALAHKMSLDRVLGTGSSYGPEK
jgi:hypothetical protein